MSISTPVAAKGGANDTTNWHHVENKESTDSIELAGESPVPPVETSISLEEASTDAQALLEDIALDTSLSEISVSSVLSVLNDLSTVGIVDEL